MRSVMVVVEHESNIKGLEVVVVHSSLSLQIDTRIFWTAVSVPDMLTIECCNHNH